MEVQSDIYNVTTYPKFPISILISTQSKILDMRSIWYSAKSSYLKCNNISGWTDLFL